MNLILPDSLCKAESTRAKDGPTQTNEQGETRGGKYAARLQVGYEKDGSPRYKYFESFDARDKYLQERGQRNAGKGEDLKNKLSDEKQNSKEKQGQTPGKVETGNLFVSTKKDKNKVDKKTEPKNNPKDKKDKNDEGVKKSLPAGTPLFIWQIDL